jgi:N utilization substance protein A
MDYEVLEALGQITREKNVPMELVLETLEAGLKSAAKKKFGTSDHIKVDIDQTTGVIAISALRKVVDEVEDAVLEISLEDAKQIDPKAKLGEDIEEKLKFQDFGRNAIQAAKQILIQRIREAEREKIFEDYSERIGEIITGSVQQIDRGNIIVNLGRPEGVVPVKEQIRRERYRQGDTIRAYLTDVQKTTKGPQIILSRTHPGFLEKLFQLEVPEIYEKIVEIKAVAREAGDRSKVAVTSNDARVDPVGACVGLKGIRVQNIVRELSNERIDIVPWSPDPATFVTKAISPAKVSRIEIEEGERRIILVVAEDQLSLAIGRAGQNVRLAAKLTGWKIDILSEEEFKKHQQEKAAMLVDISDLKGVGPKLEAELRKVDVGTIQDLARMSMEQLTQVPGVGPATAQKLLQAAGEMITKVEAERLVKIRAEAKAAAEEAAEAPVEAGEAPEELAARELDISKLRGIGPKMADEMRKIGVENLWDLAQSDAETLQQVAGVGPATAEKLLDTAREGLRQIREVLQEEASESGESEIENDVPDAEDIESSESDQEEDAQEEDAQEEDAQDEDVPDGDVQTDDVLPDDDKKRDDERDDDQ